MPTRNDEPPRDDSWDSENCPVCGKPTTGEEKEAPYCNVDCQTADILRMQKEDDDMATAIMELDALPTKEEIRRMYQTDNERGNE